MNKVIDLSYKPFKPFPLISSMNPPNFVSMEIETNSRIPITPSLVQHVTKPISPLKGGICLKIIPLPI